MSTSASEFKVIGVTSHSGVLTVRLAQRKSREVIKHYGSMIREYIGIILLWADGTDSIILNLK